MSRQIIHCDDMPVTIFLLIFTEKSSNFNLSFVVSYEKLGERAFIVQRNQYTTTAGRRRLSARTDSDEEDNDVDEINLHMTDIGYKYESSVYSSSSDESQSTRLSPVPDDANSEFAFKSPYHL